MGNFLGGNFAWGWGFQRELPGLVIIQGGFLVGKFMESLSIQELHVLFLSMQLCYVQSQNMLSLLSVPTQVLNGRPVRYLSFVHIIVCSPLGGLSVGQVFIGNRHVGKFGTFGQVICSSVP